MKLKELFKRFMDIIMPLPDGDEDTDRKIDAKSAETKTYQAESTNEIPASGNVSDHYPLGYVNTSNNGTTSMDGVRYTAYADVTAQNTRPNLKVVKAPEITMKVYKPSNYEQVTKIIEDLLGRNAVVVNYEHVNLDDQRSICDFIDGACYAIDGVVTKISERIFLYAPDGIDTNDIAALATASMRNH